MKGGIRSMDNTELYISDGLRIVFNLGLDVIDQLKFSLENIKEWKRTRELSDYKGTVYKNKSEFILQSRAENQNVNFVKQNLKNNEKQMKYILQTCKAYGVDVYIEKCPSHMKELVERYEKGESLTAKEKEFIEAFTDKDADGKIINVHENASVLIFKDKDLALMEEVVKDAEQKFMNLSRRKIKAKNKAKNLAKNTQKIKEKIIDLASR